MTDPDHESKSENSGTDLSGARQRRQRRSNHVGILPTEPGKRRTARERASSRNGPSVREKLAVNQIKLPTPSIQEIQEKLGSKSKRVNRQAAAEQAIRKSSSSQNTAIPRNVRRISTPRRIDPSVDGAPRLETQRRVDSHGPSIPRKDRRIYDARSEVNPPVMVRGGMGGMSFGRSGTSKYHKQKMPKRRFDVPLNVQGAEVRLPSVPLIHLGWRAISLLMVIMMIAALFMVWKAPVFQVKTVEAKGLKRLTTTDINAVMGTFGRSVFTLDPNLLEDALRRAFPEFSKISVKIGLPASIKVVVTERVPIISWTQDGTESWLDMEGVSFPPRGTVKEALIKVEGHGTPPILDSASIADLKNLPPGMPPASTTPSIRLAPDLVTAILSLGAKMPPDTLLVYDSEHGLGWTDPNGWEVFFGAEDQDMQMKLNVYETLVQHLQDEGIQPALISVEYVHAPYYRMER